METAPVTSPEQWDDLIRHLSGAHALQTWEWGLVKAEVGWKAHPLLWRDDDGAICAGALCLQRTVSLGGFALRVSVMYVPRGPMLDWADTALAQRVLSDLQDFAKSKSAIFLKIDPDLPLGYGLPGSADDQSNPSGLALQSELEWRGWVFSDDQIQFRNTVLIDLTPSEEDMLMRMKSKTRYNIRLAERKGVTVRVGSVEDIDLLYRMYAHTSVRDDFLIREKTYYDLVWRTFFSAGLAEPLIAEVEGQPVGAVVIFTFGGRSWYIYGMSLDEHREKMFTYLLQWEAMRRSKAAGCTAYDLWGAPDTFSEDDPMWGVFRFKDGLGGQVVRTLGAWDYPVRPLLYKLYSQVLPRILGVMRRRGKSETKRGLSA
ncbi:MAG: peptidoglycan bridge formation glycyltransferase FemA/FemB family protein [Anaerolineaceae bacterium]|nr:peptidoglycan bridge formation glycyltransferase FemA/FemB family protein [Anaerolineaceae bacterium]